MDRRLLLSVLKKAAAAPVFAAKRSAEDRRSQGDRSPSFGGGLLGCRSKRSTSSFEKNRRG